MLETLLQAVDCTKGHEVTDTSVFSMSISKVGLCPVLAPQYGGYSFLEGQVLPLGVCSFLLKI